MELFRTELAELDWREKNDWLLSVEFCESCGEVMVRLLQENGWKTGTEEIKNGGKREETNT